MWWRALAGAWVLALGYWVLRATVLSVPDYCPDKIWETGPPECDYTTLDVAFLFTVAVLLVTTCLALVWTVARRLVDGRRRPD